MPIIHASLHLAVKQHVRVWLKAGSTFVAVHRIQQALFMVHSDLPALRIHSNAFIVKNAKN